MGKQALNFIDYKGDKKYAKRTKQRFKWKTKAIRSRGYIPAVIYGNKLDNSIPIEIHKTEFQRYLDANGGDKIVEVNLNGEVRNCKITEVQIDGVKEGFLHINFLLV